MVGENSLPSLYDAVLEYMSGAETALYQVRYINVSQVGRAN